MTDYDGKNEGRLGQADDPAAFEWKPRWIVPADCEIGITVDDGCFLVLIKNWANQWAPAIHIPDEAAKKLGELAAQGSNHYMPSSGA